jgi:hypothetical protein
MIRPRVANLLFIAPILALAQLATAEVPASYQSLRAEQKQAILWRNISAQPYRTLPGLGSASAPGLSELFGSGIRDSFTSPTDEIAPGRVKVIHKWGSAGQVALETDPSSPFSGLFREGAVGIARLSLALPYSTTQAFVPGLAVKFLVDGQPSVNVTVMERLEGQEQNTNYFRGTFTNLLPNPASGVTKFGTWAFEAFVKDAIHLTVDHVAAISRTGQPVAAVKAPFQLLFVPAPGLAIRTDSPDFRVELAQLPAGTVLYEVYGKVSDQERSPIAHIGALRLTSPLIASPYEDEILYFQHAGTELRSGFGIFHAPYL